MTDPEPLTTAWLTERELRAQAEEERKQLIRRAEEAEASCAALKEATQAMVDDYRFSHQHIFDKGKDWERIFAPVHPVMRARAILAQPNPGANLLEELKQLRVLTEDIPELTDKEVQQMSDSYKEEITALKRENGDLRKSVEHWKQSATWAEDIIREK